jgi:glycosyltransferase involved in cell wall biosynthesis
MNKNINIVTQIGGSTSGVIGANIVKSCVDENIKACLFPIGESLVFNDQEQISASFKAIKNSRTFRYKAPCLKIWHSHELATKAGSGKYICMPILSSDYLTPTDIHHINYADILLLPSSWYVAVLDKHQIDKPYHLVSLGVDHNIFDPSKYERVRSDKYVFYHIGKWDLKNSQDFIIKAFDQAFDHDSNVELRLLPHNEYIKEEDLNQWLSLIQSCKLRDKIVVYNKLETQYHVADFIKNADCGLFLNRLPLLSLNLLESMSMNKPIIASKYMSHLDYSDSNAFYAVDIKQEEPAYDGRLMFGNANWAKLDADVFDQTIANMRNLYKNDIRDNPNGTQLTKTLSWKDTVKTIDVICARFNGYKSRT